MKIPVFARVGRIVGIHLFRRSVATLLVLHEWNYCTEYILIPVPPLAFFSDSTVDTVCFGAVVGLFPSASDLNGADLDFRVCWERHQVVAAVTHPVCAARTRFPRRRSDRSSRHGRHLHLDIRLLTLLVTLLELFEFLIDLPLRLL